MTSLPARKRCASILPNLLFLFAFLLLAPTAARAVNACNNFYSPSFQLVQGQLNPAVAPLAKPAKGVAVDEPNFHTCLVRATSHATEPPAIFARNDYSRRQAFNANNTYFIIYSHDGSWHLYNADTLAHVRVLTPLAGDAEPQWHPTDPNILYYLPINGGTKLLKVDVRTNASSTAVDFVGRLPSWASSAAHIWTRSEGSPSADGRYWGFLVYDASWNTLGYIVWDLQQNQLAGSRQASGEHDNVSMSASGRWFITSSNGTWAWSRDFTSKKKLDNTGGIHSDLGLSPSGQDYFVSVDYESSNGDVYFTNLDTCPSVPASATTAPVCPRTVLFPMYPTGGWGPMHFSAKSFSKPGWVLISTYDAETNGAPLPWFTNKVMAVELKASPRIYMLAYTRRVRVTSGDTTGAGNYWAEPHASVNRDFTRILFNTNWGNSVGADIDAYMIQLPTWAFGGTPTTGPSTGGNLPAMPVGGNNSAASVASAAGAMPSSISTSTVAPATTPTAGTYSIGCPACNRLAQARSTMMALAGYLWGRARPSLLATMRALDFSRDEPVQRRAASATRRVIAPIATAEAAESEASATSAAKPQAEPQAKAAPENASETNTIATVATDACRGERGINRIERDSREPAADYGSCRRR